jgi:hypothetical protein
MMTSSAARTGPRHRAPSRWPRVTGGGHGEVVMVAVLLTKNRNQLCQYRLRQYQREHVAPARRDAVIPRPRAPEDERSRR